MTKKVDMIVDLQYGSTGKGLIAGYLAMKTQHDVVVNANMPNAGHTFIDAKGQKMVHKVLPNGIVSPRCKYALIGPGSVFDLGTLNKEMAQAREFGYMEGVTVMIHPNAVPLMPHHKKDEEVLKSIGSTCQGSASAMVDKIRRSIKIDTIARDTTYGHPCTIEEYNNVIKNAHSILAEGAQGFSLGINEQFYPFCTSRDCSPARFMSDMAIPLPYLRKVIGTARTYPIRVGGTSGGHYPDQSETSWEELGLEPETTTVTGRTRRVFTFSKQQIEEAMYMFAPDEVFLNFVNYLDDSDEFADIAAVFGAKRLKYLGHGPAINDVEEI